MKSYSNYIKNFNQNTARDLCAKNIQFLKSFDKELANDIQISSAKFIFEPRNQNNDWTIKHDNNIIFDSLSSFYDEIFTNELSRKIALARINPELKMPIFKDIFSSIADKEDAASLDYFVSIQSEQRLQESEIYKQKDILYIGCLQSLDSLLNVDSANYLSITLAESNIKHMALFMMLIDLEKLVNQLNDKNISFNLVYSSKQFIIEERIFDLYSSRLHSALLGLKVSKFFAASPTLLEFEEWLFSYGGLGNRILGSLGFYTDEMNQITNIAWNTSRHHYCLNKVLELDQYESTAFVTGSGTSLDDNLELLKKINQTINPIVAGGSSISSLLLDDIYPKYLVLLERASNVWEAMYELSQQYDLTRIILICSATVDPRLSSLFKDTYFYHRPLSSAVCLAPSEYGSSLPVAGPESANAALEVAACLGFKKICLVGVDFSAPSLNKTRSKNALDFSPRDFNEPVLGNKGRTIYSLDTLITAKTAAESVISLFPKTQFMRIGEGLRIHGCVDIEVNEIEELIKLTINKSDEIQDAEMAILQSQTNITSNVKSTLKKLIKSNLSLLENPASVVKLPDILDNKFHKSIHSMVESSLDLKNDSCFVSRLYHQVIMYGLVKLYDTNTNEEYKEARHRFYSALQIMASFTHFYLSKLNKGLQTSENSLDYMNKVRSFD